MYFLDSHNPFQNLARCISQIFSVFPPAEEERVVFTGRILSGGNFSLLERASRRI